jgi:hypothetical protein
MSSHVLAKLQATIQKINNIEIRGHKHIKPHKNSSHKYNFFVFFFFGNVWTSHVWIIFACFKYI